jgi:hypothetical protein
MTEQAMQWSAHDLAAAREVLAESRTGEVRHIVTLTDEEIIILDGLQHPQLVALPWLTDQEGADHDLVGRVALRSLLVRGLVDVQQVDSVDAAEAAAASPSTSDASGVGIVAVPQITGSLVLRRTGQAILVAARTTALGQHWVYVYAHGVNADRDTIVEEEVSEAGLHSFSVYPVAELGPRLTAFMDPAGAAVMDGRRRAISASELETVAATIPALAQAAAVTVLSVVRAGSDLAESKTIYSGPAGVHVLEAASVEAPDGQLVLREVGPSTLSEIPAELLA